MSIYVGTPMNPSRGLKPAETENFDIFIKSYMPSRYQNSLTDKGDIRYYKRAKMESAFVGELAHGIRKNDNVINRSIIALDLDHINPKITTRAALEDQLNNLNFKGYLYPTLTNMAPGQGLRYRLVIPLSNPISDESDYQAAVTVLSTLHLRKVITRPDNANKTWSQMFGLPVVTDNNPFDDLVTVVGDPDNIINTDDLVSGAKEYLLTHSVEQIKPDNSLSEKSGTIPPDMLKDPVKLLSGFAKTHQAWLSDYNNYLACQFEIKYAESTGEIDHATALQLVAELAPDSATAEQNQVKYESEKRVKKGGQGLAYFVTTDQLAARESWLHLNKRGFLIVDIPKLGDLILAKTRLFKSPVLPTNYAMWAGNRWHFKGAFDVVNHLTQAKLKKAGVWEKTVLTDTSFYMDTECLHNFSDSPFDASNPYLVAFKNGTLDVKKWTLRASEYSDYLPTYHDLKLNFDAEKGQYPSTTIDWLTALTGDPQVVQYLMLLIGYCFVRTYQPQQVITVLQGAGSNGKSTFLDYLTRLLGTQNVASATLQDLGDNDKRFVTATLYQKEANIFADLDKSFIKNTGKLKSLVGGDSQFAEFKMQDAFSFISYAKLIFSANELPPINDFSVGMRRRLRVVPFVLNLNTPEKIADFAKQYPTSKINAEMPDFARECLLLMNKFLNHEGHVNFDETESMQQVSDQWLDMSDTVGIFLKSYVVYLDNAEPQRGEAKANLYKAYKLFTTESGQKSVARNRFFDRVETFFDSKITQFRGVSGNFDLANTQRLQGVFMNPETFFDDLKEINDYDLDPKKFIDLR